jgi:hypothetical protein
MPEVHTIYVCPVCGVLHDETEDALSCCNIVGITCPSCLRDCSFVSIHYSAIKVSGHFNTCNPFSPSSSN